MGNPSRWEDGSLIYEPELGSQNYLLKESKPGSSIIDDRTLIDCKLFMEDLLGNMQEVIMNFRHSSPS